MKIAQRALMSVSNKQDLVSHAQGLRQLNFDIVSTGGTAKSLQEEQVPVIPVEQVTHFPEMMDGRLKTLHPLIFGGILGRSDHPKDVEAMEEHNIWPFGIVYVNLYPFQEKVAAGCSHDVIVENIDIGGPSLIRAAAKNYKYLYVVTSPSQFGSIFNALEKHGMTIDPELSLQLAKAAFKYTAQYDAAISAYFEKL